MTRIVIPKFTSKKYKPERRVRTFPRRRRPREGVTLTELVRITLNRAVCGRPFGLFLFADDRPLLVGAHTQRFQDFVARHPKAFVGTYDRSLDVLSLVEDLRDFLGGAAE